MKECLTATKIQKHHFAPPPTKIAKIWKRFIEPEICIKRHFNQNTHQIAIGYLEYDKCESYHKLDTYAICNNTLEYIDHEFIGELCAFAKELGFKAYGNDVEEWESPTQITIEW